MVNLLALPDDAPRRGRNGRCRAVDVPRIDGYELLRRIREVGDTPVIMLANQPCSSEIVRALRAGADDVLAAPIPVISARRRSRKARSPGLPASASARA